MKSFHLKMPLLLFVFVQACGIQPPSGVIYSESECDNSLTCDNTSKLASGLSCPQVADCMRECSALDISCHEGCIAQGTPEAQVQAQAILDCGMSNFCTDEDCLWENCSTGMQSCLGPRLECPQVADCMRECSALDISCHEGCIAQGTPEAQEQAQAILDCGMSNFCTDEDCLWENCSTGMQSCLGTKWTCAEIADCSQECLFLDIACHEDCIAQGNPEAQVQAQAVLDCGLDHFCMNEDCLWENCSTEMDTCMNEE